MSAEPTIRRGVRNSGYAVVPNHVFEDTRMSMEARWLLGYLLSKPDNWIVVVADIMNKGGCGRDKVRKMIAELEKLGYAEREQVREGGKFGASVLVIFDVPRAVEAPVNQGETASVAFLPQTDLPATVMPSPVSPSPVKTAHSNNSYLENTDYQKEREGACEDLDGKGQEGSEPAETPKQIEAAFLRLISHWKDSRHLGTDYARKLWQALTTDERRLALEKCPAWFEKFGPKRRHPTEYSTYIKEKKWESVPDAPPPPVKPVGPEPLRYPARGVVAQRFAYLLEEPADVLAGFMPGALRMLLNERDATGALTPRAVTQRRERQVKNGWPKVNGMDQRVAEAGLMAVAPAFIELGADFEKVMVDSDVFAAWQALHDARGWPRLPVAGNLPVVWLPPLGNGDTLDEQVHSSLEAFASRVGSKTGKESVDA